MFAYCLNNPVAHADAAGSAAKTCLTADGAIDDTPWWDHSPGGGGIPRRNYSSGSNYYGEVADKFYTVRFFRAVGNGLEYLWNAYVHSNELQVQQQYQQDISVKNFISGELDSWSNDPRRAGDFAANLGSATVWSIECVAFAAGVSIPGIGQCVLLGVGAVCLTWSTLRYYNVI